MMSVTLVLLQSVSAAGNWHGFSWWSKSGFGLTWNLLVSGFMSSREYEATRSPFVSIITSPVIPAILDLVRSCTLMMTLLSLAFEFPNYILFLSTLSRRHVILLHTVWYFASLESLHFIPVHSRIMISYDFFHDLWYHKILWNVNSTSIHFFNKWSTIFVQHIRVDYVVIVGIPMV